MTVTDPDAMEGGSKDLFGVVSTLGTYLFERDYILSLVNVLLVERKRCFQLIYEIQTTSYVGLVYFNQVTSSNNEGVIPNNAAV